MLRHLLTMACLITAFGVVPMFALTLVPARRGPVQVETLQGAEAEAFLKVRLADRPAARAGYEKMAAQKRSEGKVKHTVAVVRHYYAPVAQSAVRRIGEFLVPTLEARRFDDAYVVYDDYSSYFDEYYDGTFYYTDGYGELGMFLTFNKDPDQMQFDNSWEVYACYGLCEQHQPKTPLASFMGKVQQAFYPTLDAAGSISSMPGYWERYRHCVLGACASAAAACFIANVFDGEILWVPCFIAWCGGAEVGCLVFAIWS
jgi:hypothetical protein